MYEVNTIVRLKQTDLTNYKPIIICRFLNFHEPFNFASFVSVL